MQFSFGGAGDQREKMPLVCNEIGNMCDNPFEFLISSIIFENHDRKKIQVCFSLCFILMSHFVGKK